MDIQFMIYSLDLIKHLISVLLGMSNITDKRYATHLNTTNNLDSAAAIER